MAMAMACARLAFPATGCRCGEGNGRCWRRLRRALVRGVFRGRPVRRGSGRHDAQRLLHGLHQAVGAKRLVQHRLQTLLACLDDRVRRVVTEPGHEDDRCLGLDLVEPVKDLVTVQVGQPNVYKRRGIRRLAHHGYSLVTIARRLHDGSLNAEQVMSRPAYGLVGIDHQNASSRQPRNRGLRTSPGLGYDRRANLVNDDPDLSGTIKQVAKAGDDVVIMPRVAVQDRRGVGDDVVKRKSHLAADRLHRGARGALLLSLEQFQRVQRRGNVAAVDLQKLAVPIVEVVRLGTLDVERADDRAMIDEWHGQGAVRVLSALDVERVLGRVGAEVALTGRGDKPRHAVPLLAPTARGWRTGETFPR